MPSLSKRGREELIVDSRPAMRCSGGKVKAPIFVAETVIEATNRWGFSL